MLRVLMIAGIVILVFSVLFSGSFLLAQDQERIDWRKARELLQKERKGEELTAEEKEYLERAKEQRKKQQNNNRQQGDREKNRKTRSGLLQIPVPFRPPHLERLRPGGP